MTASVTTTTQAPARRKRRPTWRQALAAFERYASENTLRVETDDDRYYGHRATFQNGAVSHGGWCVGTANGAVYLWLDEPMVMRASKFAHREEMPVLLVAPWAGSFEVVT